MTRPITSSETCGKRSRGCRRPNGLKNSRSRAALNGSRDAPSSPVNTEANAVQMIRMVMTAAPAPPHTWCSTSLPMDVDFSACCQGITPIVPMFIDRSMTRTATTEMMIDRGITRPGSRTSSPRYAIV